VLGYLLVRGGVGLIGVLPAWLARWLGSRAGALWYLVDKRRRTMAHRHMQRVLGPEATVERAARRVFGSYGRYWAESLWSRPRRVPRLSARTRTEGLEYIKQTHAAGLGMILALPHMGNWEAAAPVAGNLGIEVVAVAERLRNPLITRWFTQLRQAFGITVVLAGRSSMRRLEQAIQRKAAVALLCDRDLSHRGVTVTFFGEETTLPAGPISLAMRTGVPIFPVVTLFEDGGHLVKILPPIEVPAEGDRAQRLRAGTQLLAEQLEGLIKSAPDQWHLVQPNWPSDHEASPGGKGK
jgi:lauroyl/myristoyl acyltransferase